MKKIKFTLAAIAITAGIGGAFAFSSAPKIAVKHSAEKQSGLYWFTPSGSFIAQQSQAAQQASCGTPGATLCARGYTSVDGNGNGVGTPVEVKKQP